MTQLQAFIICESGVAQSRIRESKIGTHYFLYSQHSLNNDLHTITIEAKAEKTIQTTESVTTLEAGDVIFSLLSGVASVVSANHHGYIYTQNYVKLLISDTIDKSFLVYLLNEDESIKKQWASSLQGSSVLKYTVKQLRELVLPNLPAIEKQQRIGDIYLKQLKLTALKNRVAQHSQLVTLAKLKGELKS